MNRWSRRLLGVGLLMIGTAAVLQFATVWLEYHLLYPPEHQFVQTASPDGEQIAVFSVKYEGIYSWWPANPKPHFYITVTDAASGKLILRETDYDWPPTGAYTRSTGNSFTRLARVYAPWAEHRFRPKVANPTSRTP